MSFGVPAVTGQPRSNGVNRLLGGVAISVSEGEGSFDQPEMDKGAIESTMTTVSPYARFMVTDKVLVWGLAG